MTKKLRIKKSELIAEISKKADVQKVQVSKIIESIPEILVKNAKNAGAVKFPGLGTFYLRERGPRRGVNPKTKKSISIPASKTITFKLAKNVKENL